VSLIDVARRIARLAGGTVRVNQLQQTGRTPASRFIASVDRMRRLLGIEPADDPLAQLRTMLPPLVEPSRTALSLAR
jgi:hypothetical protein